MDSDTDRLIRTAIAELRLIRFQLAGLLRIAEPHDYGIMNGTLRLFVFQVGGKSRSGRLPDWRLVTVADASGFAGMGCAELLVHAGDVAEARGLAWTPPADLADAVLARLFPWAPADGDPAAVLRWVTGRAVLPGREPVTSWRWHCAPLDEWDGAVPA